MNAPQRNSDEILDRFLDELGEPLPSPDRAQRAAERVLENISILQPMTETARAERSDVRTIPDRRWIPVAAIAAVLVLAALVGMIAIPSGAEAMAKTVQGNLITSGDRSVILAGETVRTDNAGGAVLSIRDGSRVEMGAGVELSMEAATDGIQINLSRGNVIVTAAKQHHGHLYVKTRDCVVSVVGTVFSVNAEAAGSRVAVIEGEVHVQHGDVSQNLLPGQQVVTNAAMSAVPLQSEIGWSQDAVSHLALLQQSTVPSSEAQSTTAPPTVVAPAEVSQGNAGPIIKNKTFFFHLMDRQQNAAQGLLSPSASAGFRSFKFLEGGGVGGAVLSNTLRLNAGNLLRTFSDVHGPTFTIGRSYESSNFSFIYSDIQGRTLSFINEKGTAFSYGCADCSFTVLESGITDAASNTGPGIAFNLSADGVSLTVTCQAVQCQRVNLSTSGVEGWQHPPNVSWAAKPMIQGATITIPVAELLSLPVDASTGPALNRQAVIFSFAK